MGFVVIMMLLVSVNTTAQTTVTLETDSEIKITLPKDYIVLPSMEEDEEGPYKQWMYLRLGAVNQDHYLLVYTIIREMPKEGQKLIGDITDVNKTDTFVFSGLENMILLKHEHQKWHQWGKSWSKKIYQSQDSSWYAVTFVSHTDTHMIVVYNDMDDLKDVETFDTILKSIDYKKGFFGNFYTFCVNHEFLSSMFFIICGIIVAIAVSEGREHDKKSFFTSLLIFLLLMGWLLFAFEGDWLFVGTLTLLGILVMFLGVKVFKS